MLSSHLTKLLPSLTSHQNQLTTTTKRKHQQTRTYQSTPSLFKNQNSSDNIYSLPLRKLIKKGNVNGTLTMYNNLKTSHAVVPTELLTDMSQMLVRCSQNSVEDVQFCYDEAKAQGHDLTNVSCCLVRAYVSEEKIQEGAKSAFYMLKCGLLPDENTSGRLLKAMRDARMYDEGKDLFESLQKHGAKMSSFMFGLYLGILSGKKDLNSVVPMYYEMQKIGNVLNSYVYQRIIILLINTGKRPKKATEIYQDYIDSGLEIEQTFFDSYISALSAVRNNLYKEKILECYADMRERSNGQPPEHILTCVLDAANLVKKDDVFDEVLQYTRSLYHPLNPGTYNRVLDKLVRNENSDEVESLISEMNRNDIKLNAVTYRFLIEKAIKESDDVEDLLKKMKEEDVEPNRGTYAAIIKGFVKETEMEKAIEYFEEMKRANLPPSTSVYNYVIQAHLFHDDQAGAAEILREMKAAGNEPTTTTFACMIDGLLSHNHIEMAVELFDQMSSLNLQPKFQTYVHHSLIRNLILERDVELVRKHYASIIQRK